MRLYLQPHHSKNPRSVPAYEVDKSLIKPCPYVLGFDNYLRAWHTVCTLLSSCIIIVLYIVLMCSHSIARLKVNY